jgi:hypothetical protein
METTSTEEHSMETTTLTRRQAAAFRDLLVNADYLTEALRNSMKARLVAAGFAHYVEDADDFKAAR